MTDETPTPAEDAAPESEAAAADATPATEPAEAPVAEAVEAPAAEAVADVAAAIVDADAGSDSSSSSSSDSSSDAEAQAKAEFEAAQKKLLKPAKGARYYATGKRKTSVARVILTPGDGTFWINGRTLENYFPRNGHRTHVMEPFVHTGAGDSYHVRARIHGGGISGQAHALQHGIAKALAEVDPAIRTHVKGKGLLKVDTRQVERKKAGLKKARKKPQFSKR